MSKKGSTWWGSKHLPACLSASAQHLPHIFSGYLLAITAVIMAPLSAACVQAMEDSTPPFQLNTFRLIFQTLFGVLKMSWHRKLAPIRHEQVPWIIYITITNVLGATAYYAAASYLQLSAIGTVFNLLLTVIILAVELFLRSHKTGKVQVVASILAVLGCVLNIQPWYIFNSEPAKHAALTDHIINVTDTPSTIPSIITDTANHNHISIENLIIGLAILLLSATAGAVYYHIVGGHLAEMEPGLLFTIVSSFGVVGSLVCSLYLEPFDLHMRLIPRQLLLTVVDCTLAGLAALFMTAALQVIGGMRVALTMSFDVLILLILQYTLMKNYKPGYRNMLEATGVLFTVIAMILSPIFDFIRQRYASHVDLDY